MKQKSFRKATPTLSQWSDKPNTLKLSIPYKISVDIIAPTFLINKLFIKYRVVWGVSRFRLMLNRRYAEVHLICGAIFSRMHTSNLMTTEA